MIPFNKPFLTGNEIQYIRQSVETGKISGDGLFTRKCHEFFQNRYHFKKALLTTSCTDALEMAAILTDIQQGDEVIIPGFTFVSTANAFVLRGAKIIFCDSYGNNPNMDTGKLEQIISKKTKVIVPVHYAGVACDMDEIMSLAGKYGLRVVEDAAQCIDSFYKGKPLGSIGEMAAFSFHETKNIISGEGGMLVVNDERFANRAEIIREKGTNRSAFFRGETDKYGWVDIGSSFLPSDIMAAFLFAQLENIDVIQRRRKEIWNLYKTRLFALESSGAIKLPFIPDYAANNAHMFYVLCGSLKERTELISRLREKGIYAVFHYQSLHTSAYYKERYDGAELPNCDKFANTLVRLPMFYQLKNEQVDYITDCINAFYKH